MADLPDLDQVTLGGVPFSIIEGPFIDHSADGTTGREVYRIAKEDIESFLIESVPYPVVVGGFVAIPPRRTMPGADFLFTNNVHVSPFVSEKPGDPLSAYGNPTTQRWYRVEIEYRAALEDPDNPRDPTDPVTFLEAHVNAGFETINIPSHSVNWVDVPLEAGHAEDLPGGAVAQASRDINAGVQKIVPTIELTLRWPFARNPNWEYIIASLGKLNDSVNSLFGSSPIETVQFMGVTGSQKFVWAGGRARAELWSLDFHFSIRCIKENGKTYGWNHAYRPDTRKFEAVLRQQGGDLVPLYETTDLLQLFRAAT